LNKKSCKKSKEEGIVAGVLFAGLIFSPIFLGQSHVAQAQAAPAGKTKKVFLIASEKVARLLQTFRCIRAESSIMQWSLMVQSRASNIRNKEITYKSH
jgi:hypothetical protein